MSASPPQMRHPTGAGSQCKGTTLFWIDQKNCKKIFFNFKRIYCQKLSSSSLIWSNVFFAPPNFEQQLSINLEITFCRKRNFVRNRQLVHKCSINDRLSYQHSIELHAIHCKVRDCSVFERYMIHQLYFFFLLTIN